MRRWWLPFGSCAVIFGLVATVVQGIRAFEAPELIAAAVGGGLLADAIAVWLMPSITRPKALSAFAGLAPMALWGVYVMTIAVTGGVGWAPELWSGAILWSGLVGLGLSLLIQPLATPQS